MEESADKLWRDIDRRLTAVQNDVAAVRRRLWWSTLFGIVKLVIILIPIILAVVYLPPFLSPYFDALQHILTAGT